MSWWAITGLSLAAFVLVFSKAPMSDMTIRLTAFSLSLFGLTFIINAPKMGVSSYLTYTSRVSVHVLESVNPYHIQIAYITSYIVLGGILLAIGMYMLM